MPTPTLTFNPVTSISTTSTLTFLDSTATVTDGGNALRAIRLALGSGLGTLGVFDGTALVSSATFGLITCQYDSAKKILTLRDNTTAQTALGADFTTALRLVAYACGTVAENATQSLTVSLGNPIYSGVTGHYYEYVSVSGAIEWPAANTAANARNFLGLTGYLATITSSTESATSVDLLESLEGWIGGTSDGTPGNARIWKWSAGPEANTVFWNGNTGGSAPSGQYTNWATGRPNNGGQANSTTNLAPYIYLSVGSSKWLDGTGAAAGYYVEYSTVSGTGIDGLSGTRSISNLTTVSPFPALIQATTPIQVSLANGAVTSAIGVALGGVTIGATNATHIQVSIDLGTSNAGKRRQAQGFRLINGSERELVSTRTRIGEVYNFVFLKTVDGSNSVNLLLS